MEKRFCDICEAPADKETPLKAQAEEALGDPYQAYKSNSSGGVQGIWQCKIIVRPVITFEDHPKGIDGPPDLCGQCLKTLLSRLADSVDWRPNEQTTVPECGNA